MSSVFFVGPLPPPVHGFSVINGQMLDAMRGRGAAVQVFDMAPRSRLAPLWQWLAFMGVLLRAGRSGRGGGALYLPISGGVRQLINLAFALPAKLLGLRIFVHHHSFAYLNQSPWHARWAFAVLRHATTGWNEDGRLQGLTDTDLSPAGEALARGWWRGANSPGPGAKVSGRDRSVTRHEVVATGYRPVGAGSSNAAGAAGWNGRAAIRPPARTAHIAIAAAVAALLMSAITRS